MPSDCAGDFVCVQRFETKLAWSPLDRVSCSVIVCTVIFSTSCYSPCVTFIGKIWHILWTRGKWVYYILSDFNISGIQRELARSLILQHITSQLLSMLPPLLQILCQYNCTKPFWGWIVIFYTLVHNKNPTCMCSVKCNWLKKKN